MYDSDRRDSWTVWFISYFTEIKYNSYKGRYEELLKIQLEQLLSSFIIQLSSKVLSLRDEKAGIKESLLKYIESCGFDLKEYRSNLVEIKEQDSVTIYQISILINSLLLM